MGRVSVDGRGLQNSPDSRVSIEGLGVASVTSGSTDAGPREGQGLLLRLLDLPLNRERLLGSGERAAGASAPPAGAVKELPERPLRRSTALEVILGAGLDERVTGSEFPR